MRNVGEAWNGIHMGLCCANPSLSVKMAPKLRNFGAKDKQLSGYYDQNEAWAWIWFAAKLFQRPNQLIRKVYRTWEGLINMSLLSHDTHSYPAGAQSR